MILINGNFLCRNLTGIERFAWETCRQLDLIVSKEDNIALYAPANAKSVPEYKNIKKGIELGEISKLLGATF